MTRLLTPLDALTSKKPIFIFFFLAFGPHFGPMQTVCPRNGLTETPGGWDVKQEAHTTFPSPHLEHLSTRLWWAVALRHASICARCRATGNFVGPAPHRPVSLSGPARFIRARARLWRTHRCAAFSKPAATDMLGLWAAVLRVHFRLSVAGTSGFFFCVLNHWPVCASQNGPASFGGGNAFWTHLSSLNAHFQGGFGLFIGQNGPAMGPVQSCEFGTCKSWFAGPNGRKCVVELQNLPGCWGAFAPHCSRFHCSHCHCSQPLVPMGSRMVTKPEWIAVVRAPHAVCSAH